jgi:hypothetical protein
MHKTSWQMLLERGILNISILIFYLFFSACTKKPDHLLPKNTEKTKIEGFLTQFLFEEAGVYTLFGDKPMTCGCFFVGKEEDICLDGISEESLKSIVYIDTTAMMENWNAWKKYATNISPTNFCFVEMPCPRDPSHILYYLVNINEVKKTIEENEDDFQTRIGINRDNFETGLKNPQSDFWTKVLTDHYLMGLLHGYGKENSSYFIQSHVGTETENPVEPLIGSVTPQNFPLPIYAPSQNDSVKEKYQQQREEIKKIYKDKNFLDVTLTRLCH